MPWFVWCLAFALGMSGLLAGFAAGVLWGARRGGPAWMAAFYRGGADGMRVTMAAFEDEMTAGSATPPSVRFEACVQAEREGGK